MKTKLVETLTAFMAVMISRPEAGGAGASPDKPVVPNRRLPKVNPPKTGLEFSTHPTTQDIIRAQVFEEALVPIGSARSADENAALAAALLGDARRSRPDDFVILTGFLEMHPSSLWRGALLTCLGLEYYNTARCSLALEAWEEAWPQAKDATDGMGDQINKDSLLGPLADNGGSTLTHLPLH